VMYLSRSHWTFHRSRRRAMRQTRSTASPGDGVSPIRTVHRRSRICEEAGCGHSLRSVCPGYGHTPSIGRAGRLIVALVALPLAGGRKSRCRARARGNPVGAATGDCESGYVPSCAISALRSRLWPRRSIPHLMRAGGRSARSGRSTRRTPHSSCENGSDPVGNDRRPTQDFTSRAIAALASLIFASTSPSAAAWTGTTHWRR
jgi:hypothetical protein